MTHAECSPSQLSRIVNCPGSRRLVKLHQKRGSSDYADEGTMLHDVVACKLKSQATNHLALTTEQAQAVQDCVGYYHQLYKTLKLVSDGPVRPYIEHYVKLDGYDEVAGTSDVIILSDNRIDIVDWKFGLGVPVYADNNVQGLGYALAAMDSFGISDETEVHIHIVQPRLEYYGDWSPSLAEVAKWYLKITDAVRESRTPDARVIPGEVQCRWCIGPACDTKVKFAHTFAQQVFEMYAAPVDFLQDKTETLLELRDKAKLVSKFIAEIEGYLITQATNGKVPGYKVVNGRSIRKWKDEAAAEKFMLKLTEDETSGIEFEDIYDTKFVSCAKAEKLSRSLKKDEDFKALIIKPSGKAILVPEADSRQPIKSIAQEAFKQFAQE